MQNLYLHKSVLEMVLEQKFIDSFNSTKKQSVETLLSGMEFIAQVSLKALKSFKKKDLEKFDALVGENACQLRACKIMDLAQMLSQDTAFQEKLKKTIACAKALCEGLKKKIVPSIKKMSLKEFCAQNNLKIFDMGRDLEFIVQSYLLTHTKVTERKEGAVCCFDRTEIKKLEEFGLQKTKASKVVTAFQQKLAQNSLVYLIEEGDELSQTDENIFVKRRTKYLRKDSNGRLCSPCFYSFDVCLKRILEKKQSVVIVVERFNPSNQKVDTVKMHYKSNGKEFEVAEQFDGADPVIVIEGPCVREDQNSLSQKTFIEMFTEKSLTEILMANAAQHALYPGKLKGIQIPNDLRLEKFAKQAEEIGCSYKNPTLFLIEHIYASKLEDVMKKENK